MDPNLHQKQGINHMNKVLAYAPMVAADGHSTVHLTVEDWHVVADTLFRMNTPKEMLPDQILDYGLRDDQRAIELSTADLHITIEII